MLADEHDSMRALSDDQIQLFIRDGFVRIDRAFPRELADQARTILWRGTGCDPHNPATWTKPVIRLSGYKDPPFLKAERTPVLHAAFDQIVGKGRRRPPLNGGPAMFDRLFTRGSTVAKHTTAPYAEERARYLQYKIVSTPSTRLLLTIPFAIPAYWTPEQALAVVELLEDLRRSRRQTCKALRLRLCSMPDH